MKNYNRDLLVLYKPERWDKRLLETEVEALHGLLFSVERNEVFCCAHELVRRNRITSRRHHLLEAIARPDLKPFYFLINKN